MVPFAWKWIMIINNKLSISRFTPTLFKKMWKSHRSLWLLWFTMPCDPSYACFTLVYVKRNLTEYMDRSSSINLPFDRRPATYLIHGKLWVVVTRFFGQNFWKIFRTDLLKDLWQIFLDRFFCQILRYIFSALTLCFCISQTNSLKLYLRNHFAIHRGESIFLFSRCFDPRF